MASLSRKKGIIGALVIAGVFNIGAYVFSGNNLSFFTPKTANAESTQQLLEAYAQKDSDHDGLPDWEEALYGTDPYNAHSFSPTLTDGQAVAEGLIKPKFLIAAAATASSTASDTPDLPGILPSSGSMTDEFAQQFFGQYIQQQDGQSSSDDSDDSDSSDGTSQPTDADIDNYANGAMQAFIQGQVTQDPYTISNVQVQGSGPTALMQYIAQADAILGANTVASNENEIEYFADGAEKNDPTAFTQLAAIGRAYSAMAPELMELQVPSEMQYAHLEFSNSIAKLGIDDTNMSMYSSDPLRAYVGLSNYETDATSLAQALSDMRAVLNAQQVVLEPSSPGYDLYQAIASTTAQ